MKGVRGELELPNGSGTIGKQAFRNSLKIVVAHHYLFEPPGYDGEELLQLVDRRAVFTNIASADVDVYLCGHKHVADFWPRTYAECFENERGLARHALNMYRRVLGIHLLPAKFFNERRTPVSKSFTNLFITFLLKYLPVQKRVIQKTVVDTTFIKELADELVHATDNVSEFKKDVESFFKKHHVNAQEILEVGELNDLQNKVLKQLTPTQREQVKAAAYIMRRLCKEIVSRPFLQIMAGTAGKRTITETYESKSFNIYEIVNQRDSVLLRMHRYAWHEKDKAFLNVMSDTREFFDKEKIYLE